MCCCIGKKQRRGHARGHIRRATTMHDILLAVGFKYALCRQFIFLSNALLIGCSMALVAAGIQQSNNEVGKWLGSAWYQTIMGLGGSLLLTTLLGCTGSCYQNRPALVFYIIVMVLLIIAEGSVMFLASSNELDKVLQDNWKGLTPKAKQDLAAELGCDDTAFTEEEIASCCVGAAREEANASQRLILFVCGGLILYQLLMIAFTWFYLKGLKQKRERAQDIKKEKAKLEMTLSPSDGVEELDSNEYKNIKHI